MAGEINTKHKMLNKTLVCQVMLDSNGNNLFADFIIGLLSSLHTIFTLHTVQNTTYLTTI